jgi:hypothetical protein
VERGVELGSASQCYTADPQIGCVVSRQHPLGSQHDL